MGENGLCADALLRLATLTGEPAYREAARGVLQLYARTFEGAGSFGATYARALRRFLSPEISVRIVGEPAATDPFREAALRLPAPLAAIRTLTPEEAPELGLPPERAAYVCAGSACGSPVRDASDLRDAYELGASLSRPPSASSSTVRSADRDSLVRSRSAADRDRASCSGR